MFSCCAAFFGFASFVLVFFCSSGDKLKTIDKGMILAALRDIWRICWENLPLQKSNEIRIKQPRIKEETPRNNQEQHLVLLLCLSCCPI